MNVMSDDVLLLSPCLCVLATIIVAITAVVLKRYVMGKD